MRTIADGSMGEPLSTISPAFRCVLRSSGADHRSVFPEGRHEPSLNKVIVVQRRSRGFSFYALLGDPVALPTVPVADGPNFPLDLASREGYAASSWHTDVTFVDAYPKASILRAIEIIYRREN